MADDPASPDATPQPVPRAEEEEEGDFATGAAATGGAGATRGTATQAEYDDEDHQEEEDADPLADQSEFESLKQVRLNQWKKGKQNGALWPLVARAARHRSLTVRSLSPPPSTKKKQALLNERIAPEILDYRAELVSRVSAVLDHQDQQIADLEQKPGGGPALRRGALALERDRLRFLYKSYLRARAAKIQAASAPILDSRALCARLSPGELRLANDCFVASGRLMKAAVLDGLPGNYRSLVRQYEGEPGKRLLCAADARAFVFCRALRDLGAVADGERGETLDMGAGDLHVVRYASVAELVRRGQACLL
jgi:GINS complex subunit 4